MVTLYTWLSRPFQVSVGVLWTAFCFFLFFATGGAFGKQASSQVEESKEVSVEAGNSNGNIKSRSWTVHCEREDGTQGIFRVSSNVHNESSPQEVESERQTEKVAHKATSESDGKTASPKADYEDPFGSPALKCGRLLTLLAIFATAESSAP